MSLSFIIAGMIVIGFLLILIEIFLVPGVNIFGIVGFALIVLGIVFAYTKLDLRVANFIMVGSLILSIVLVRVVLKSKAWRRLILIDKQEKTDGFHSSTSELSNFVGKRGVSYTNLRPAGVAIIDDQKVDVVTEGGLIEIDRQIEVVEVSGNRVVVRELEE